jgi:hypothetical protein
MSDVQTITDQADGLMSARQAPSGSQQVGLCRKPVLVVTPKGKGLRLPSHFSIRLLTAIPPETFPAEKLKASRNNLRSVTAGTAADGGEPSLLATPHYNASILEVRLGWGAPLTSLLISVTR